jgi:hypothetical protein
LSSPRRDLWFDLVGMENSSITPVRLLVQRFRDRAEAILALLMRSAHSLRSLTSGTPPSCGRA